MGYYDLDKTTREKLNKKIQDELNTDINNLKHNHFLKYFGDSDTYIRKAGYLAIRDLYLTKTFSVEQLINHLLPLLEDENELIRQTAVNALGELGVYDPQKIIQTIEPCLKDTHHRVRNAMIGTLKKISLKQPKPVLEFCKKYMFDEDPEIRRQVLHGIELHGRNNPKDLLPILRQMQGEKVARVRNMAVHVLGQISYKAGTLDVVLEELTHWHNKILVQKALAEIVEVHSRYEAFSEHTTQQAKIKIEEYFKSL